MARPKLTDEQKAENKQLREHIQVSEAIKKEDASYSSKATGFNGEASTICPIVKTEGQAFKETIMTEINHDLPKITSKPTIKSVFIHSTCELIGMRPTFMSRQFDIHEYIDGTGRLLIVGKKDKRKIVISPANIKAYELL